MQIAKRNTCTPEQNVFIFFVWFQIQVWDSCLYIFLLSIQTFWMRLKSSNKKKNKKLVWNQKNTHGKKRKIQMRKRSRSIHLIMRLFYFKINQINTFCRWFYFYFFLFNINLVKLNEFFFLFANFYTCMRLDDIDCMLLVFSSFPLRLSLYFVVRKNFIPNDFVNHS